MWIIIFKGISSGFLMFFFFNFISYRYCIPNENESLYRTVLQFCFSLLHLAKSKKARILIRIEEEEVMEDSRGSLLAANIRLASDLCFTFTSLRSGRSKEVSGHLAVSTR